MNMYLNNTYTPYFGDIEIDNRLRFTEKHMISFRKIDR